MATQTATPTSDRRVSAEKASRSQRGQKILEVWVIRVFLIVLTLVSLFPTLYIIAYSFKKGEALYSPTLLPTEYTFANYQKLFNGNFLLWVGNSLILGITSGAIAVMMASLGGYAFSRFRFPGRRYGILILLIVQMLPTIGAVVALFRMFQLVGLLNSRIGLIILFGVGGGALSVWLMKNFMDSIPVELDQAAYIDGATHWQTFWRVIFPLVQPMLVAQFIFGFIGVYNEYVITTIFLSDPKLYPLGVGVRTFATKYSTDWTIFCAAAVLGSIPILIIFFMAQRFLVEGLTKGALKG
jgi:arabinogalactan oligomer/maltooligosaccharide transport system permease protein